jgi:hypothetical protein
VSAARRLAALRPAAVRLAAVRLAAVRPGALSGSFARARAAAETWGSTAAERAVPLPCDRHLPGADGVLHRAIDIDAPPGIVFRWLCQLRVAPYSYDLVDNFGRRSPQHLIAGLDELAVGQRFMTIFDLVEFEPDRHITLVVRERARWAFGTAAVTYAVAPRSAGAAGEGAGPGDAAAGSRLLVRIASPSRSRLLPWLDLLMMRRQLLNLKRLAEAA